jgi:hypothetical protein
MCTILQVMPLTCPSQVLMIVSGQLRIIGYSLVDGGTSMHEPRKVTLRRRDLLLAATAAGAAAALGAASIPPADAVRRRDKRKPQYRSDSPEVQTYYRVNRYPAK